MEALAEREFELRDASGVVRAVVVRIGRPEKVEPGFWTCAYEIAGARGAGVVDESAAHGEDGMQALILALQKVGEDLACIGRTRGSLTWLGAADLGFPRALTAA